MRVGKVLLSKFVDLLTQGRANFGNTASTNGRVLSAPVFLFTFDSSFGLLCSNSATCSPVTLLECFSASCLVVVRFILVLFQSLKCIGLESLVWCSVALCNILAKSMLHHVNFFAAAQAQLRV